jgi:hypothetical protein
VCAYSSVAKWTFTQGRVTTCRYPPLGQDVVDLKHLPAGDLGVSYFRGFGSADAVMTQTGAIPLDSAVIDSGNTAFALSGWFGGFKDVPSSGRLTLTFLNRPDSSGSPIGQPVTIGPVNGAARQADNTTSGMEVRVSNGRVPVGARAFKVDAFFGQTGEPGGLDAYSAYADNLSLILTPPAGSGTGGGTGTGISVNPTALDFGTVTVGQTSPQRSVTITNTSASTTIVNLVTSAPFSVTPASLTLGANGGTGTASVTFSPTSQASSGSSLYVYISGQTSVAASVALTGMGVTGSGGGGNIVSLKVESGTYNTTTGQFTNPFPTTPGTIFDTDDGTKNFALGVSLPGVTNPLLNNVPNKALKAPIAGGTYYTYYSHVYTWGNHIRLTVTWSSGPPDVAYFAYGGTANNAVWQRAGGSANLSVNYGPQQAPCKVLDTSTQPPSNCTLGSEVLILNINGGNGSGSPAGGVTASPQSLDFGTVTVGQTSVAKTVALTNTGSAPVIVNLVTSAPFAVSPASLTLAANGGTGIASITYTPSVAGSSGSALYVFINGQSTSTPAVQVPLTGMSTAGSGSGGQSNVLKVDGGQFDSEVGYPNGTATAYFVNRLTPSSYPATINNVQIYFSTRPDGLPRNTPITVISATNPSGSPLLSLATTDQVPATITALDQFISITVPSRTITSGDFVVGFMVQNPPGIFPADEDQITPSQGRSYTSNNGVTYGLIDAISPNVAGNLGIRAVVTPGSQASAGISVNPSSLDFGSVAVGQTSQSKTITLTNTGTTLITVNLSAGGPFAVSPASLTIGGNGFTATASVTFKPSAVGPANGTLIITASGQSTAAASVTLTGTGAGSVATPAISVNPASLDFGTVTVGQTKDLSVQVSNTGTATLNVTSINAPNAPFAMLVGNLPGPISAGQSQQITIRFSPTVAGAQTGTLIINSNDPAKPTITVNLTGTGAQQQATAPSISVTPASLDFGTVTVNQTKDLPLQIANTGNAALNITSIGGSSGQFTLVGSLPSSIAAGSSQSITIRFSPAASGTQTGTLTIRSNDPLKPAVTVNLSGTGGSAQVPTLQLPAQSIDFGNVKVGQVKDIYFVVNNVGAAFLTVKFSGLSAPMGPGFGTDFYTAGMNLAPVVGGQGTNIRFSPTSPGAVSQTMVLTTNDPARPTVRIPVTGTGTP